RSEVGVTQTQLAVIAGVLPDLVRRVAGVADDDLLRGEDDLHRVAEARDVETAARVEELEQVQAREVARRVVQVHVLRARVRPIDPACGGTGVPPVDRRVVLHPRVRALPGCLRYLTHQVARGDRLERLA